MLWQKRGRWLCAILEEPMIERRQFNDRCKGQCGYASLEED